MAWIRAEAVETTQGVRFRVRESPDGPGFPAGLYDGAAGIALVLADWTAATGDPAARDLLHSVADGLAESGSPRDQDTSLYFGLGGRALALLRSSAILRDPGLLEAAVELAGGFGRARWTLPDLLYGPPGTGIVALQLHRATGDRSWLQAARHAFDTLVSMNHPGPATDTGLAHGVGGILPFLDQYRQVLPGRRLEAFQAEAWRWFRNLAIPAGRGVAWPKSPGDPRLRHHWCHGTAGLVLALETSHGAPDLLDRAGRHAWESLAPAVSGGAKESACHCHGLAGTLDALGVLAGHGCGWARRPIVQLVDRLEQLAGPGDGPASFALTDAGLETGVAGVVHALMRVAGMRVTIPYGAGAIGSLPRAKRRADRVPSATPRSRRVPAAGLPLVAAPLRGDGRLAVQTAADHPRLARAARRLLDDARLDPLHEAWAILGDGLAALGREHRDWIAEGALAPEQHLAFLQRLAGMLLFGMPTPAITRHRREVAHFLARRHVAAVARALRLLAADRRSVLASVVAGELRQLRPLDGEPHRGGQRALALTFAGGPALIFKPRDLRVEAWIVGDASSTPAGSAVRLNARLARTLGTGIPTYGLWPAGPHHGYAEYLSESAAPLRSGRRFSFEGVPGGSLPPMRGLRLRTTGEATAFWRAAGALASQLAAFGVTDQHTGNLRLAGSRADRAPRLHAMDCEVAFQHPGECGMTHLVPSRSRDNPEPGDGRHTHYGFDVRRWDLCGYEVPPWALSVDRRGRLVPVEPPGSVQRRLTTPIVVAPDGSCGYGAHTGAVLRGAVEHWLALRAELDALEGLMRRSLDGVRVRVLRKSTTEYVTAVTRRELGSRLWVGATAAPLVPSAQPFGPEELAQIGLLDVPAFDRALGDASPSWTPSPPDGRASLEEMASWSRKPWWRIPRQAARTDALARMLGDLTAFVAPATAFSVEDPRNGVHIVRSAPGEAIQLAISVGRRVAQVRLDPDGGVTHWGLPPR